MTIGYSYCFIIAYKYSRSKLLVSVISSEGDAPMATNDKLSAMIHGVVVAEVVAQDYTIHICSFKFVCLF